MVRSPRSPSGFLETMVYSDRGGLQCPEPLLPVSVLLVFCLFFACVRVSTSAVESLFTVLRGLALNVTSLRVWRDGVFHGPAIRSPSSLVIPIWHGCIHRRSHVRCAKARPAQTVYGGGGGGGGLREWYIHDPGWPCFLCFTSYTFREVLNCPNNVCAVPTEPFT